MSLTAVAVVVGAIAAGWAALAFGVGTILGRAIRRADEAPGFTVPDEMPEEWRR